MSEEEKLEVVEENDGTAVVNLPDETSELQEEQDAEKAGDDAALRDAKRDRRRAKRELARKTSQEKDVRLVALQRQNDELLSRLQAIEQKTQQLDQEKLDRRVQDADLRLRYARQKVSEAASAGDGEALTKAEEMLYNARKEIDQYNQFARMQQQRPQVKMDPRVIRNVQQWQDRTPWYDGQGKDVDSKIVKQIDETLTEEGWNPAEEEYWDELDNRLQQYLPHRYNQGKSRPRMQTSAGREMANGGSQNFTLSAEQVRAMKDAGMWDDLAKRNKMIRRYYDESRRRV